ncbi:amidase [Marilutibacter aestuarii]|uniref:Amidase n=1 Tax=Marilutibacter aestuarii TaxID=1706195 RepID=A0A507ZUN4_9GAMM|nr:amidase [Lysobacter aestuarii]TQD41119.1 amidase [Lysobacter aestuarii]
MRSMPATACLLLLAACQPASEPGSVQAATPPVAASPTPRVGPAAAAPAATADTDAFAFAELDIQALQARMARGETSSQALTQAYLDRIAAIDDAGPTLNAVIELNPDALEEAAARDAQRKAGPVLGPLHGIPVLLKDNIDATPMVNSAGSLALAEHRPTRDAFLVDRLRAAGAVILGKTNLSEWANFRSTRSSSGWSGRGGQTLNPYALDRSPCGSSAGTGSAISANLAAVGIGTETDGSIICPSAVAGLVGLKPTVGLVSRNGIIPISSSQDTAGPMTRSVADAAILLAAMAGRDDADAATAQSVGRAVFDYPAHLDPDALRGARIGLLRGSMGFHPDVDDALERAVAAMRAAGATIVDAEIPTAGQWRQAEFEVLLYEFKNGLEHYLRSHDAPVKTLDALIAFNQAHVDTEMPWFGQELFEQARVKGPLNEEAYLDARREARRLAGEAGIDAALEAQELDALLAPATSPAWRIDPVLGDHFTGAGYGAAAVAGYPSLTVPMGESHGLPIGLVFMGTAWSEPRLIALGHAYEQLSKARTPPRFLSTAELKPRSLRNDATGAQGAGR